MLLDPERGGVIKRQQISDVIIVGKTWQLVEHMPQIGVRFDPAGAAGQHQAIDYRAGLCARHRGAEQPIFSASCEGPDIPFDEIVINRGIAVVGVATQVHPLVSCISYRCAQEALG